MAAELVSEPNLATQSTIGGYSRSARSFPAARREGPWVGGEDRRPSEQRKPIPKEGWEICSEKMPADCDTLVAILCVGEGVSQSV